VLIVTRSEAVPVLEWVVVAPVTCTIRGIATEVPLGEADGLSQDCVASFDNLQPIRRGFLTQRVAGPAIGRRAGICAALDALADR
jgi:mRNA interferase MazF